jgi:hypothetical protein
VLQRQKPKAIPTGQRHSRHFPSVTSTQISALCDHMRSPSVMLPLRIAQDHMTITFILE